MHLRSLERKLKGPSPFEVEIHCRTSSCAINAERQQQQCMYKRTVYVRALVPYSVSTPDAVSPTSEGGNEEDGPGSSFLDSAPVTVLVHHTCTTPILHVQWVCSYLTSTGSERNTT